MTDLLTVTAPRPRRDNVVKLEQTVTVSIEYVEPTPERIRREKELWDSLARRGAEVRAKKEGINGN